jgi:SOS-response transcriptional repressor LexA
VVNRETQQVKDAETEAQTAVQEAIDANPELSAWQVAEDQSRWNEAARLDKALRESPLWRSKSFDERFVKVVELTQAIFGEAKPVEKAPVQAVKVDKQPAPTEAEIRAAAEAKLAAKNKAAVPVSLSQIPGGTPPAVDEKERVEQMSSIELGNKFLRMNEEQLKEYLATL